MAYRKIHDEFWTDPDMEEYTRDQKYFYLYLITNPKVNQIGLYEFSIRRAAFETGFTVDEINDLISFFIDEGKIILSQKTKEILVVKFWFHNQSRSPKMKAHVNQLLSEIKDTSLIQYIYDLHMTSQEEEEEEEEEDKEKEEEEECRRSAEDDVMPNATNKETWQSSIRVAEYLLQSICQSDPTHKYNRNPPSLLGWVKQIDLGIRRDGRTESQFIYMIDLLFKTENSVSNFWRPNIESGKKLRDKFDTIKGQFIRLKKEKPKSPYDEVSF